MIEEFARQAVLKRTLKEVKIEAQREAERRANSLRDTHSFAMDMDDHGLATSSIEDYTDQIELVKALGHDIKILDRQIESIRKIIADTQAVRAAVRAAAA